MDNHFFLEENNVMKKKIYKSKQSHLISMQNLCKSFSLSLLTFLREKDRKLSFTLQEESSS